MSARKFFRDKTGLRLIRTASVAMNTKIGDYDRSLDSLTGFATVAAEKKVTLCVFPEGALGGYPVEDFVNYPDFVEGQWTFLEAFAEHTKTLEWKTIFALGLVVSVEGYVYNAQAWVCDGKILGIIPKEELPEYWNFTDIRNFKPGHPGLSKRIRSEYGEGGYVPFGDLIFDFPFARVSGVICEDSWVPDGPLNRRALSGATLFAISNASDYRLGVYESRVQMLSTRSSDEKLTIVSSYQVGGHAGTVYDGGALFFQAGRQFKVEEDLEGRFTEGMWIKDFDMRRVEIKRHEDTTFRRRITRFEQAGGIGPKLVDCQDWSGEINVEGDLGYVYPLPWKGKRKSYYVPVFANPEEERLYWEEFEAAQTLAVADVVRKNGFLRGLGACSGGKDSFAGVLLIAKAARRHLFPKSQYPGPGEQDAKVADFLHCYSMPTRYNADQTRDIARLVCKHIGATFAEEPIEGLRDAVMEALGRMAGRPLADLDQQNCQPRLRFGLIRSVAATLGAVLFGFGNLSERLRGYYTKGGDQQADHNLLGGTPKTLLRAWLEYQRRLLGWEVFDLLFDETEESAELKEGQADEDEMGPLELNDLVLPLLIGERLGARDIYRVMRQNFTDEEIVEIGIQPDTLWAWIVKIVGSYFGNAHKHDQDPPSTKIGTVHIDSKRINRIPIVNSSQSLIARE